MGVFLRAAAAVAFVLAASPAWAGGEDARKVLVEVAGQKIFEDDLAAAAFLMPARTAASLPKERLRALVLAHLVDQKALVAAAAKQGSDPEMALMVAMAVADKVAPPPPGETEEGRVRRIGYVRDSTMGEKLLAASDRAVDVGEAALRRRYGEMSGQTEVRLRYLVVPSRSEADAAVAKVRGGAEFAAVAKEVSADKETAAKGGDLGYLVESLLTPLFSEAVRGLKHGEMSLPVSSDVGWNVIHMVDRRTISIAPYEKLKPTIVKEMLKDARDAFTAKVRAETPMVWHVEKPPGY